jgi:hypothetical protein
VKSAAEDGSLKPNGLEEKLRISPKKQAGSVDLAAVVLEGEQSLRASERPFRGVGF